MVAADCRPARSARLPPSGSASIARMRSPRILAIADPSATVTAVLPTPPLSPKTPIWYESRALRRIRLCSSSSYTSSGDRPRLMRVIKYSQCRQPRCDGIFTPVFTPTCESASMARWLPMLAADDCVGWLGTGIAWPARHAR